MFQPPCTAALGRALLRAALAVAVIFTAHAPSEAEAQRGPALRLQALELVELGQAHGRRGTVTRWGLHYRKSRRARANGRFAQLEVTLERGRNRQLVRHVQLTGRQGTVAIGPARGQARVRVRALDPHGRPMAIRIGRGPRQHAIAMTAGRRQPSRRPAVATPVTTTTRVQQQRTRSRVTVNGRARLSVSGRTERTVNGRTTDRRWDRTDDRRARRGSTTQLREADRACRDAFTGDDNEMRCLQIVRFRPQAAAQVAACEDAFTGDEAELRCLEIGADPRHVQGCEDMLTGDAAELQCLETVSSSRARPAMVDEVLRVCDERVGDAAELACVADLLSTGRRAKR